MPCYDSKVQFAFIRSLFRVLNVIPIFAGTDSRAIGFCCPENEMSRLSGAFNFWTCVFSDFPSFELGELNWRCEELRSKFGFNSPVIQIVDFLESIYPYENPLLLCLAFDFLDELFEKNARLDPELILDQLLYFLSIEFILRKNKASPFNEGQISYIFSYNCKLHANPGAEGCVNGHLAYLKAFPSMPGEPYFKLAIDKSGRAAYFDQPPEPRRYISKSYYRHFLEAPLTGLVLFGLNLSRSHHFCGEVSRDHAPFLLDVDGGIVTRSTTFDAIYNKFDMLPYMARGELLNRNPSGARLVFLFRASAIAASRANGIAGSSFPVFLRHLLGQFLKTTSKLPDLDCPEIFNDTIIPVVAPMKTPVWPASVVKLLSGLSSGAIHLGVLDTSTKNEPVDCVIYELSMQEESGLPSAKRQRGQEIKETKSKIYGFHRNLKFDVTKSQRREVLACECIQYKDAMTLSQIKDEIILHKFKDNCPDCNLFIVLIMDFNGSYGRKTVNALNDEGYRMWGVEKADKRNKFVVSPLEYQCQEFASLAKDVIIISMRKVWDDDSLYDEVRRAWDANISDNLEDELEDSKADEQYDLELDQYMASLEESKRNWAFRPRNFPRLV